MEREGDGINLPMQVLKVWFMASAGIDSWEVERSVT